MASEKQDLVPCCAIKDDSFHLLQSHRVTVDKGIIEHEESRSAGFLEQVGIRETAD